MNAKKLVRNPGPIPALALVFFLGTLTSAGYGAALSWDPGATGSGSNGGSGTWSTGSWWNGSVDGPWVSGTDAAFSGGATPTVSLGGPITANNLFFNSTGYSITGSTLTLTGGTVNLKNGSVIATIGSIIAGSAGLTQTGTGTLTLNGPNTYTGTTTISSGTLLINNTNATTAINVGLGSKLGTLGGSGSATSATATVPSNAKNGIEAGSGGVGSLTLGGLHFQGAASIYISNIGQYASAAGIDVTGNNGLTVATQNSLAFVLSGTSPTGSGSVHLLQYAGALQGTPGTSAFITPTAPVGTVYSLSFPAGFVDLDYAIDHLVWTGLGMGADAGVWTVQAQSPPNWKWASAGTPTNFQSNAPVVFDDSAGTNTTVSISGTGNVNPGSVTFSNSSVSYLIQGTYGINQQAVLTKNGNGSLTIANSNSYYGGTVVNAGRLNVANSALGTGTLTLNGGTIDNTSGGPLALAANNSLAWNSSFVFGGSHPLNLGTGNVTLGASAAVYLPSGALLTIGGPIADSATGFTQNGQGLLVFAGSSSYTGQTNVNGGTLSIGNGGSGASINATSGVALGANVTLLFNHSDAVSFAPAITGGGAVVQSGGLLSLLNGGNSYSGGTVVTAGTLQASIAGGIGPTGGSLTVASGGVVDMNNVSATLGAFNGSGLIDNSGSGSATLTVGSGGANGTFSGTIQNTKGMLSLVKTGAGTLVLSGTGTFTGATTINGGQLNTSGAALQGSTVNVSINNSLTFSGTAATLGGLSGSGNVNLGPTNVTIGANNLPSAYSGTISGAGGLTKTGSGVFALVTPQNYGGATSIAGGTLRVAAVPTASLVTTNLLYDLDASNPASYVLTGGSVTAWNDSSGNNGGSFTSGTAAASAVTVVNGGASFNGNNVMYFNGSSAATLTCTTSTTPFNVFIVERVPQALSNSDAIWGNAGQSNNIRIGGLNATPYFINPGTAFVDYANSGGSLGVNGVFSSGNVAAGSVQLLEATAGNYASVPWAATALSNASSATGNFNGYIGEVVAYSGYLSDSDRQQMEAYLMYKWLGTVLPGGASNLLPATTPLTISNSGKFDMTNGTQTVASLSSIDGKGSLVLLGTTGMLTVGGPASSTFDGVISGIGGSLVKQGAGNLTLSGINTYGGGTTVTGGTLQLGDGVLHNGSVTGNINTSNNTAVVVANPAAQIFSNVISGNSAFAKSGSGTLTISSTQAYTAATFINKGVVRLVNEGSLSLSGFGVGGTGWQVNSVGISSTPITNDVLTLTDGGANESRSAFYATQLPVGAFNASFIYQPALGSTTPPADGVTFMLQNSSAGVSALGQTNNGSALGYAGSSLTTPGSSPHITPSVAIGLDIFHNAATGGQMYWFSDGTAAATVTSVSPVNLDSGDPIQVNVNYDGTNYLYLTLTDNGLTYSSSRAVGNLVTLLGGSSAYVGFSGATGGNNSTQTISNFSYTLLSSIAGSNSGNILPATTAMSIASGGTLDLFGGPQQIAALSGGGVVTNSANGALAALTVSGTSATSFSGTINDGAGQVSLALTGGTLTLGGNNSYSGGTTISGGAIIATKTAGLGTGPVDLGSGALNASANGLAVSSLTVADSGPSTLSVGLAHPLAIGGNVNLSSGGTLNISGILYSLPALVIGYSGARSGTFDNAYYNGSLLPAGDSLSYSGGSIEVVGTVTFFSGSGSWIGTSNAWNSSSNWTDGFGHHGVPGDGTRPAGTDAANFSGSSSVTTINLSPTNPTLSALSFSNSNYTFSSGSLTLYRNSGPATITVLSGSSTFNATTTLNLANSATVNPSIAAELTINGSITGIYPLALNGPGTLVLSGSSNFGGGINVEGGTLIVTNVAALADGSSLTVGSAATFSAPLASNVAMSASTSPVSSVPEPGTLALFVVGGFVAATAVRRLMRRTAK